jgi:hypothetical protein
MRLLDYKDSRVGESVFLLGNGPSLGEISLNKISNPAQIITMNRSWDKFPATTQHVIIHDTHYLSKLPDWKPSRIFYCGSPGSIPNDVWYKLKGVEFVFIWQRTIRSRIPVGAEFFDLDHGWKVTNTGALALQLAIYMGYSYIFLLGYDCYGGHYHDSQGAETAVDHAAHVESFEYIAEQLKTISYRPKIMNCSRNSKITMWPKLSFEDALDWTCRTAPMNCRINT